MRSKLWAGADATMLLAFALSVIVQFNDPDPWAWVAVYGLAAAACALSLVRRGHWVFPALVGAGALAWAATLAPRVIGDVPFSDMFLAFEMADVGIEESREMYGLLLIAAWMVVLSVRWRRRSSQV